MAPVKIQAMPNASNGYSAVAPIKEMSPYEKLVDHLESDITQALEDYERYTYQHDVLEDVSDTFIYRLAKDAASAKEDLREMMRKSPCWDEDLQAWMINGNRTHNPDYGECEFCADRILEPLMTKKLKDFMPQEEFDALSVSEVIEKSEKLREFHTKLRMARNWFTRPDASPEDRDEFLEALKELAPNAYHEGRKISKIFRLFCKEIGVLDETAGSHFQYWYAKFADEINSKQIGFKLFVSINPCHFLTMSNPKADKRGDTLTSCHSFNATEYDWNCGCSGYARDGVTMIAFTVEDPEDDETLNNRKTSRQLYMYKPGNGVLLQSRMYNTGGGTRGAQEETKVYRDLIEREIAYCEGFDNLWTVKPSRDTLEYVRRGEGFGGYPDWEYWDDFDPHICIQKDAEAKEDWEMLEIGTYGLCVSCGCEIDERMYCEDCSWGHYTVCSYCRDRFDLEDGGVDGEEYFIFDDNGDRLDYLCPSCAYNNFTQCEDCGNYYEVDSDLMRWVESISRYMCQNCLDSGGFAPCEDCGEYYPIDDMVLAYDCNGDEVDVCLDCLERNYHTCPNCGAWISNSWEDGDYCPCCGVVIGEPEEEELEEEAESETDAAEEVA